jgi:hypothetical protein
MDDSTALPVSQQTPPPGETVLCQSFFFPVHRAAGDGHLRVLGMTLSVVVSLIPFATRFYRGEGEGGGAQQCLREGWNASWVDPFRAWHGAGSQWGGRVGHWRAWNSSE